MPRVIGYTWNAAAHCVECTQHAASVGFLRREPPIQIGADVNGLALDLVDREGNAVGVIFSTDECAGQDACDECAEVIQ